jgi:hypothetical protein
MIKERKYETSYKPRICIAKFNMIYYPESSHKLLVSKNKDKVAKGMKEIKTIVCNLYPIVLNEEGQSPTENLRMNLIKFIWKQQKVKGDLSKYRAVIRDVNVISESRVCYQFDEFKH